MTPDDLEIPVNLTAPTEANSSVYVRGGSGDGGEDYNGTCAGGDHCGYVPYSDRPETYVVPVIFSVIFILGILGNGFVILIVLRKRSMHTVPNIYIVSLSLGDLLVILISVPFIATIYTFTSWQFGRLICKLTEYIKNVSVGVSVFTLTALSADRYLAIVHPMRIHIVSRGVQTRRTVIISLCVWLLAALLAVPDLYFSDLLTYQNGMGQDIHICWPFPQDPSLMWYQPAHSTTKILANFLLPLAIISSFYCAMAVHLYLSTKELISESHGEGSNLSSPAHQMNQTNATQRKKNQSRAGRQMESRKKVAKMVLSFVILFAFCWLPIHIVSMWTAWNPNWQEEFNEYWNVLRIAGFCLSFINSCTNPVALYFLSAQFRKYYQRYLFCCCCPAGVSGQPTPSSRLPLATTVRRTSTSYSVVDAALNKVTSCPPANGNGKHGYRTDKFSKEETYS